MLRTTPTMKRAVLLTCN